MRQKGLPHPDLVADLPEVGFQSLEPHQKIDVVRETAAR